jgi:Mg-chelatase subunit ChlD
MKASLANLFAHRKAQQNLFCLLLLTLVVFPYSASVQADDKSLRIRRPTDSSANTVDLTPQGNNHSQSMQIRLSLPGNPSGKQNGQLESDVSAEPLKGGLTQVELKRLAAHDIVLLIDKSGSMRTPDCPVAAAGNSKLGAFSSLVLGLGGMAASRWDWCLQQTSYMAKQTETVLASGFTVVLFDSSFAVFPHVTVQELARIFRENRPGGGTDLSGPLASTFDDYFGRKRISKGNIKPLLIGVITDGCPNYPIQARQAVVSGTRFMSNANEITVIFFLIGGNDRRGEQFAFDLSHNLVAEGAAFQIVHAVPFHELEKLGLARALADNLQ